ncbi:Fur family transcriptional regulator [Kosmotoga pacifica]|uniref:Fur family transcriptional regulator n=1 Tax=Kosmotoga pacifica TaxID=1330330 RepID=A0A0G2Z964_9BACT|nr:Fur family transcriptional regulator [Kosmotoga pacifica]AKI98145.1 hypothetical protein IX53_10250 [Kosmotoga pacifica]
MHLKESVELLKRRGYRITPQRIVILKVLENNRTHPTAEDIFLMARKSYPAISIASVYNVLEILEKEGIVKSLTGMDGIKHYDPDTSFHAHFFCRNCRKFFDFEGDFSELSEYFERDFFDYKIESVKVIITGLCPECRNAL